MGYQFRRVASDNVRDSWVSILLERPRIACQVNHLHAIIGPNAPHDSVDVILYSLLGKVQACCDLLIRKPLSD